MDVAVKRATIIGAGLVGSLWALFMAKRGYQVDVYERRPDMRKQEMSAGRSINLALSDRGLRALRTMGLEPKIREMAIPMHGRLVHMPNGNSGLQPYGEQGQYINSISRGGLNALLMYEAEQHENVTFHFNTRSLEIDQQRNEVLLEDAITGKQFLTKSDVIFATDGAFSMVRNSLLKTDRFDYSQQYLAHGYKELSIPPAEGGGYRMEHSALHIWPRKSFMLIALPNLDGSFTCTLFLAFEGAIAFENLTTEAQVQAFFQEQFPDVVELMPNYVEEFFGNPTSSLVTVKCYPWVFADKIALMGDAAHALVPFYGQGMNSGFEDCTVMNELADKFKEDWPQVLETYQQSRKPNADAIAELAVRNFIEMRDLVADPFFQLQKQVEKQLHLMHPNRYVPLYPMVTFSEMNYAEALRRADIHDAFFKDADKALMQTIATQPETEAAQELMDLWVSTIEKRY
ncbi:NAD(P)/FAD-dependent oxidoreductase [soil metagenome]